MNQYTYGAAETQNTPAGDRIRPKRTEKARSRSAVAPSPKAGRPAGDSVRGPIICFALGLILAVAGVSGGDGAVRPADAIAAESSIPPVTPVSPVDSEAECATREVGSTVVYLPPAGDSGPIECEPAPNCCFPAESTNGLHPNSLHHPDAPQVGSLPLIEAIDSMKEKCERGFSLFRMRLELHNAEDTGRKRLTVVAYENPSLEVRAAAAVERAQKVKEIVRRGGA